MLRDLAHVCSPAQRSLVASCPLSEAPWCAGEVQWSARSGHAKSFRTGRLERELQMVQLSTTRCSCIAIVWVSLVSFAVITICVTSQRVFIIVSVYFVIDSVRKLLDTPSYICEMYSRRDFLTAIRLRNLICCCGPVNQEYCCRKNDWCYFLLIGIWVLSRIETEIHCTVLSIKDRSRNTGRKATKCGTRTSLSENCNLRARKHCDHELKFRSRYGYTRAVWKVRGLALLLRVGTSWRCGDGLFFEVPPLASEALLTTLHPLLENVLQTVGSLPNFLPRGSVFMVGKAQIPHGDEIWTVWWMF
jgi:hypothetical protein